MFFQKILIPLLFYLSLSLFRLFFPYQLIRFRWAICFVSYLVLCMKMNKNSYCVVHMRPCNVFLHSVHDFSAKLYFSYSYHRKFSQRYKSYSATILASSNCTISYVIFLFNFSSFTVFKLY